MKRRAIWIAVVALGLWWSGAAEYAILLVRLDASREQVRRLTDGAERGCIEGTPSGPVIHTPEYCE